MESDNNNSPQPSSNLATLGGGCFWCIEAAFSKLKGVISVRSGYSGGQIKHPSYKEVCRGTTGHAEVVQIEFDPGIISFETLLEVFWTVHDPTTLNRQGGDVGTQYRSAIFYHDQYQKQIAEKSIEQVANALWNNPVVTEIVPFETFYEAEPYHQDYFDLNPEAAYCSLVINPKIKKVRDKFHHLLKE